MPIPYKVKLNNGNENIGAEAKTITVQEIVKNATNKRNSTPSANFSISKSFI